MEKSYAFINSLFQEDLDNWEYSSGVNINKLNLEDEWLAELDYINHFPSFNNLSFDDMVAQKLLKRWDEEMNWEILSPINNDEYLINQEIILPVNEVKLDAAFEHDDTSGSSLITLPKCTEIIDETKEIKTYENITLKSTPQIESSKEIIIKNEDCSEDKEGFEKEKEELFEESLSNECSDSDFDMQEEEVKLTTKQNIKSRNRSIKKRKAKTSFTRWGKDKDKMAFKLLESMCREKDLNITKFIQTKLSKVMNEKTQEFVSNSHKNIVEFIANKYNWVRKPVFLFQRFQKIHSLQNNFSIRELKFLKKILVQHKDDANREKEVLFHFPGKSKEAINEKVEKIMQTRTFAKFRQTNL